MKSNVVKRLALLLVVGLFHQSECVCQSFDTFFRLYQDNIFKEKAGEIPKTIRIHSRSELSIMTREYHLLQTITPSDSEITYQRYPFSFRTDSFYENKVKSSICQDSIETYIRSSITGYKCKKLSEVRGNTSPVLLDNFFFDPVIGWQIWGAEKPTVMEDTVFNNVICYKLYQKNKRGNGYNEHIVRKDNFHLLCSMAFVDNALVQKHTFDNFKVVQGIVYPFLHIIDTFIEGTIARQEINVQYVFFDRQQLEKGLYDCSLKGEDIR